MLLCAHNIHTGTVLTGLSGSIANSSLSGASLALADGISFSGICGNPAAPAILAKRDNEELPQCRYRWSLPRIEGPEVTINTANSTTALDSCFKMCAVGDAPLAYIYRTPLLAVRFFRAFRVPGLDRPARRSGRGALGACVLGCTCIWQLWQQASLV